MNFVITGATSFLGIELISYLLENGHSVVAVCRPNSEGLSFIPAEVTRVLLDMSEYHTLSNYISSCDVFINLAWNGTGHDGRDSIVIQEENVKYSTAALEAAWEIGCKLFVEAGSQAEYGITEGLQSEDIDCMPISEYGKAKLQMKHIGFDFANRTGVKYMHLRIFSLIGENDHQWTLVMSAVSKMLKNDPIDLSQCSQTWNFLYVKDAVKQICGLCDYALNSNDFVHEVYNIASQDTRKLKDFVEEIKHITNSSSRLNYGAVIPKNTVSLNPQIDKQKKITNFVSDYNFEQVIKIIIQKITSCHSQQ